MELEPLRSHYSQSTQGHFKRPLPVPLALTPNPSDLMFAANNFFGGSVSYLWWNSFSYLDHFQSLTSPMLQSDLFKIPHWPECLTPRGWLTLQFSFTLISQVHFSTCFWHLGFHKFFISWITSPLDARWEVQFLLMPFFTWVADTPGQPNSKMIDERTQCYQKLCWVPREDSRYAFLLWAGDIPKVLHYTLLAQKCMLTCLSSLWLLSSTFMDFLRGWHILLPPRSQHEPQHGEARRAQAVYIPPNKLPWAKTFRGT